MNLANKVTVVRIGLIPLFVLCLHHYPHGIVQQLPFLGLINRYGLYAAVALFLLAAATDKLDGHIARRYNQVTNLGKLLDPLADKLLISAALVMMVQHHLIPSWIAAVIIGREVLVSGIRILAAAKGIALSADRHGKAKLALQVAAIVAVLLSNYPFAYVTGFPVDMAMMFAAVGLTVYSGYKYILNNYRQLELELTGPS